MIRAAVLAAMAVWTTGSGPAGWEIPDNLAKLPADTAVCNRHRTHCLVNYEDWVTVEMVADLAAEERKVLERERDGFKRERDEARAELETERASKMRKCARVERIATP